MHRSRQFQQFCCLLFLPVLIGIPTSVHAVNQTTRDSFFGPDLGDALSAVSQAELSRQISEADQRSKPARPRKSSTFVGFGGEVLANHTGNASMSAESQPEILPAFIGSGFRRAPPRSSMSVVIPSPGNSPTFGGFGGEVLAHTRNGPSSAASSTLYPSDLWMPSVASKGEDTLWRSEGSGFRRRERPCEPHVLSGCSAKWKYCGCDLPALNFSTTLPVTDTINIGSWNGSDQSCTPSCLLDTFTPLPPGPKVSRVQLTNIWAAPDNRPFPVAEYLANLQTTLSNLELFKMYLPTITRDSFAGFVALWRLVILHSHVSAIDINAFATVGDRPGSALPQLWSLTISHNNIATLDWSVFAPLMSSVKFIELENDNIQRIVRSRSYVVHSLESVRIVGNPNLTSIDDRFLRSVSSASRPPVLDLTDSPICSDSARCQRIAEIHGPIYCCWAAAQKQTPR